MGNQSIKKQYKKHVPDKGLGVSLELSNGKQQFCALCANRDERFGVMLYRSGDVPLTFIDYTQLLADADLYRSVRSKLEELSTLEEKHTLPLDKHVSGFGITQDGMCFVHVTDCHPSLVIANPLVDFVRPNTQYMNNIGVKMRILIQMIVKRELHILDQFPLSREAEITLRAELSLKLMKPSLQHVSVFV